MHPAPTVGGVQIEDISETPGQGGYRLVRPTGGAVVVELLGEHDLDTTPQLRPVLFHLVEDNDLVVLDLSDAEFVDSSVLLMIVQTNRLAQERRSQLRVVSDETTSVHRVLALSRVLDHCDVAPTRAHALRGSWS
jgi:anti-anti-sigma factor